MSDEMKNRFYEKLEAVISAKGNNNRYLSAEKYQKILGDVKSIKEKTKGMEPHEYRLRERYDVLSDKLIVPVTEKCSQIKYYAKITELFSIVHDAHLNVGHGGRLRVCKEINEKYTNVPREAVCIYLQLCEVCQKKQKTPKKGLTVKPMIFNEMNSRCQVDLIDFQAQADGELKFILVYQDHLTKFVILRALKRKSAEEVARNLVDIFNTFGAPSILQSDNGREFANKVIEGLASLYPGLKIVHGKPRHSQSQGSVERANQDIENILSAWLQDNPTKKWGEGLSFVQLMKNRAYHEGIKRSPYEAMFGCPVKIGLQTPLISKEVLDGISTDEQLEELLNSVTESDQGQTVSRPQVSERDVHREEFLTSNLEEIKLEGLHQEAEERSLATPVLVLEEPAQILNIEDIPILMLDSNTNVVEEENKAVEERIKQIEFKRKLSVTNLKEQAKKMKLLSATKFPSASVGNTVRIQIPDVDRARGDARNILGVVLEVNDELYKIGTTFGKLNQLYARNQFGICNETFVTRDNVPDKSVSLREVARLSSITGGQGYERCHCKKDCGNKKCSCKSKNVLCNSKCHKSGSCQNK